MRRNKSARNIDLNTLAKSAHGLKAGKAHGPADEAYAMAALIIALIVMVGGAVATGEGLLYLINSYESYVVWIVAIPTTLILALFLTYFAVMKITEQRRLKHPSWSEAIDSMLVTYDPIDIEAWDELRKEIVASGGIEADRLLKWIKAERVHVKAMTDDTQPAVTNFIPLPGFADSGTPKS